MVGLPESEAAAVTVPPFVTRRLAAQRAHDLRAEAHEHRLAAAATPMTGSRHRSGLRPLGARLLLRLAHRLDAATVTRAVPRIDARRVARQ